MAKKRTIGRPKQTGTLRYQVLLEEQSAEWAKQQPGGLSGVLRVLLREAFEAAQKKS